MTSTRGAVAAGALTIVVLLATGCGSSSAKAGAKSPSNGASTTTSASGSGSGSSTGGDAQKGTIAVTGGDQFSGALITGNQEACSPRPGVQGASDIILLYAGPNGTQRELDVNSASVGTMRLTAGTTKPSLRYSDYEEAGGGSNSDYFDWGTGGQGGKGVTGTLIVTSSKDGSLTGDMAYAHDESNKYPSTYKQPVHVLASWKCP
jgi:hypothetical protein